MHVIKKGKDTKLCAEHDIEKKEVNCVSKSLNIIFNRKIPALIYISELGYYTLSNTNLNGGFLYVNVRYRSNKESKEFDVKNL